MGAQPSLLTPYSTLPDRMTWLLQCSFLVIFGAAFSKPVEERQVGDDFFDNMWANCGKPGMPPCFGGAKPSEKRQIGDDFFDNMWANCGKPGMPPCFGGAKPSEGKRQVGDDFFDNMWANCGKP